MPVIIGSNITKLNIDSWPNLRNISKISNFKNLESLSLRNQKQMIDLPEKIFSKNDKLKELVFYRVSPNWNSNSLTGKALERLLGWIQ